MAGSARSTVDAIDLGLTALAAEVIDYGGWQRIDAHELQRGQESGRDRAKINLWTELRAIGAGRSVETRTAVERAEQVSGR